MWDVAISSAGHHHVSRSMEENLECWKMPGRRKDLNQWPTDTTHTAIHWHCSRLRLYACLAGFFQTNVLCQMNKLMEVAHSFVAPLVIIFWQLCLSSFHFVAAVKFLSNTSEYFNAIISWCGNFGWIFLHSSQNFHEIRGEPVRVSCTCCVWSRSVSTTACAGSAGVGSLSFEAKLCLQNVA